MSDTKNMKIKDDDQLRIIIALVRKLGGEVELTDKDLLATDDFELQRSEPELFGNGLRFRTRLAPITVEGELEPVVLAVAVRIARRC